MFVSDFVWNALNDLVLESFTADKDNIQYRILYMTRMKSQFIRSLFSQPYHTFRWIRTLQYNIIKRRIFRCISILLWNILHIHVEEYWYLKPHCSLHQKINIAAHRRHNIMCILYSLYLYYVPLLYFTMLYIILHCIQN